MIAIAARGNRLTSARVAGDRDIEWRRGIETGRLIQLVRRRGHGHAPTSIVITSQGTRICI